MNLQSDSGHLLLILAIMVGALLVDHFWNYPGADTAVKICFVSMFFKLDPKTAATMLGTKTQVEQKTTVEEHAE